MTIEILEPRIAPAALIVTNLLDSGPGSLRAALSSLTGPVNGVPSANSITFAKGLHGTINLKSSLPAITDEDLTLAGPGEKLITINGHDTGEIFDISVNTAAVTEPLKVTISGLTLSHGSAVGSATGKSLVGAGGALLVDNTGGTVALNSCIVTQNQAIGAASNGTGNGYLGKGGAIDLENGTLTLFRTTVTGNVAMGGAAPSGQTGGQAMGGGIYVGEYATLTLSESIVTGNKAIGGTGLAGGNGTAGTKGSQGQPGNNGTDGASGGYGGNAYGGAIFSLGTVSLSTSTVSGNIAIGGAGGLGGKGGAGGAGGRAFTSGGTHYAGGIGGNGGNGGYGGNGGNAIGGGITSGLMADSGLPTPAALTMLNSTVSGNTATPGALGKLGAGGKAGSGSVRQNGQTYHGMKGYAGMAGTAGNSTAGGIYSYYGTLNLTQVTIAKNVAGNGGGIYVSADPTVNIDNCTIAFNKATVQGGGIFAVQDLSNDPINVISTIIGQNSSPSNSDVAGYLTASNSLIQVIGNANIVDNLGPNVTGESPLLGSLGFHGGLTETLLPGKHSPALGAGTTVTGVTPATDQRGEARVSKTTGDVDIGSVQVS